MIRFRTDYDYKLATLKAVDTIIASYINPKEDNIYFHAESCPLCKIYNKTDFEAFLLGQRCEGCFMHREMAGNYGCTQFRSFRNAKKLYYDTDGTVTPLVAKAFRERADFFVRVKPLLERSENSMFNPKKWRFFSCIDRSW